ncbi:MAG: phosphoribosylformylglycinamidine cyclo-ligase [bacterium]|jgi:phosphoribosylformylglycinamidine cyclo-ligase|nr:phosphoribosylformylglycinamidine cyclo-ligase [bacterium]
MTAKSRYAQAGVDISAGDQVKKRIGELVHKTHTPNVLHKEGAFGGLFSMQRLPESNPVLVSSVEGVGTKVKIAREVGSHVGIGKDLVNHCINDILTCGARPLFFLDYFACEKLENTIILQVIEGMSEACRDAGIALIGGETAQMSDVYAPGEYDLAGTIVGVVDESKILDGRNITPGDQIIALPSSGLHTNGYTLARKVLLEEAGFHLSDKPEEFSVSLGEALLEPHISYLNAFRQVESLVSIKGIAHITGGGFEGNIPRVLPETCQAVIDTKTWTPPILFRCIQETGKITKEEMYQVFNMGIGIVFIVSQDDTTTLKRTWSDAIHVGEIVEGHGVKMVW